MTITLELPPDLESRLAAEAAQLHLPLDQYLLRVLEEGRAPLSESGMVVTSGDLPSMFAEARAALGDNLPRTGAELIAYWEREGVIHSAPDDPPSPEYARILRERNQNRQHN